jgi:glutamate synthase (NADPH/NADH) large chain
VVNYFFFVAEEVRQIMAQLGIRKFDDLIGRADLLDTRKGIEHWKARGLDFSRLFAQPNVPADVPRFHTQSRTTAWSSAGQQADRAAAPAIERGEKVKFIEVARNVNRSVGAMLSGAVTKPSTHEGLPDDTIRIQLEGTGGQSFGAFLANGITLYLIGDANDYTGKGLSGGRIVVRPSIDFRGDTDEQHHRRQHRDVRRHHRRGLLQRRGGERFACACPAPRRWSKARATTAANT